MLSSRNCGDERLHPDDPRIIGATKGIRMSNGYVDLSFVPDAPKLRRRVQREDAAALKARLKRERKPRNRNRASA
jgi:hypothetical protein